MTCEPVVNRPGTARYVLGMADASAGQLWRYEARHCGWVALGLPVLAGLAVAAVAAITGPAWHHLLAGTAFPVLAGLAVADVAGREPAPELQSSVARPYWATMGRRLALAVAALTAGAVLATVSLAALGAPDPAGVFARAWCSAIFLGGVAAAAGAWLRSVSGASTVVLAAWLAQFLVLDRVLGEPPRGSVALLVAGAGLLAAALRRLSVPEHVLTTNRTSRGTS